ncbi:MAG: hypothetical protein HQ510_11430 [Candidatus Marinimicrobia bacterium]|nr:hypothetical protein [Candidatus Neomarinimicrobiota bacterium]
MKLFFYFTISIIMLQIAFLQNRTTARGIVNWQPSLICPDLCYWYFLTPDPGYEHQHLKSDFGVNLIFYAGQHVEVSGITTTCTSCGIYPVSAINVQSITIIVEVPTYTVSMGTLQENTDDSSCPAACADFRIEPNEGYPAVWLTTQGESEILMPFLGEQIEFIGEEISCDVCNPLELGFVNVINLGNQVINGSFESGGEPALGGWAFPCVATVSEETPITGTGRWNLKLGTGYSQGCWLGTATSTLITAASGGDILTVSGWAKQDNNGLGAGIRVLLADAPYTILGEGFTDTADWTFITFTDTLLLNQSINLQVVLDAGLTDESDIAWAYFDQIVVQKIGQMLKGDVNADYEINVLDIVIMVSIILSISDTIPYQLWAGDMNLDEIIDVLDVVILIDWMIHIPTGD